LPVPAGDVHGAVRDRPDPRLARAVAGAGAGQGAEDRPAQADLHRRPDPRLRARLGAMGPRLKAPKGVIWDLGNVLIQWDPHAAIAAGVGADEATRFMAAGGFDFMAWENVQDAGGALEGGGGARRPGPPHPGGAVVGPPEALRHR